ncbi:molybdopterin molybdotransferase MoeA [soil metagenome]
MRSLDAIASCLSGYDPNALHVDVARDFIRQLVGVVTTTERLPIRSALGRVLAVDLMSPINVPAHDNSAMDGYAFRGADLMPSGDTRLRVSGKVFAGDAVVADATTPGRGECVRIMTGAVMPVGLDTVVPQEFVKTTAEADEYIDVPAGAVKPGDNRRRMGEDLAVGHLALTSGRILRPADIGMLASLGQTEVSVFRRLRVAFFSTGNELRSVGDTLEAGCVYDSNRYTLWAMLTRLGVDVLDLGVVRDDPITLASAFRQAAADSDAIITSGGVGVGEADHTKQVMASVGDVAFWSVAMRPGRPLAVGSVRNGESRGAVLFGLPGNPVAVMTTFYALVRDALLTMSGSKEPPHPYVQAVTRSLIRKRPGRTEFQRAVVTQGADGRLEVMVNGSQGSGMLRTMSEANALAVLAHDQGSIEPGQTVDVLLFDGLV